MEFQDYYKTLNVDKKASASDIKAAYRKLAKKYHPDLNPDDKEAQEKFKKINEAYEVLGDEEKRKKYDQFGSNMNFQGGQNFDPSDFGFYGFSNGGPYSNMGSYSYQRTGNNGSYTYTNAGNVGDFSDFFNMFFGQGSGFSQAGGTSTSSFYNNINRGGSAKASPHRRSGTRTDKYQLDLKLTIKEAYQGGERKVRIKIGNETKDIDIKWPAGIREGNKIRIKGSRFGLDGDLVAKINITGPDKLEGLNIVKSLSLYPWEAYFGTSKTVESPKGKIKVNIPPAVKSGSRIRIPGQGYRDRKKEKGDLYLEIMINNPEKLSEEEEKIYKKLAKEI